MMRWREGYVTSLDRAWAGAQELTVSVGDTAVRALAYPDLVGAPLIADRVLLNVAALERGLGTGGYALVVAIPDRLPADPAETGHLVKARYTPLQTMVLGADEQDSPDHDVLRDADDLAGAPVVVADLHSALPAVLAGVYDARPGTRIVYVMTDGGALPLAFSRTVPALREAGWLTGTVINAAGVLGGRPVASLRISSADPRPRHRGVSHHSLTAYGRVALHRCDVVVPDLPGEFGDLVRDAAEPLHARHHVVRVGVDGLYDALRAAPLTLSTMGRDLDADRAYFEASAAAGRHAAGLLSGAGTRP